MATQLKDAASSAFFSGFAVGCLVAAGVALVGTLAAAILLPAQPIEAHADDDTPEIAHATVEVSEDEARPLVTAS